MKIEGVLPSLGVEPRPAPSSAALTLLSGISEVPNMSIPKSIMLFTAFSSLFISALSISLNSVSFDRCFPKPGMERNGYPRKILLQ